MSDLREYLQKRLEELEPQERELLARLAPVQDELSDVRRALQSVQTRGKPGRRTSGRAPRENSIQGQVMTTLASNPSGMTASAILWQIKEGFGRPLARESLAPQLSRLCADNHLMNENGVYRLTRPDLAPPAPADRSEGGR